MSKALSSVSSQARKYVTEVLDYGMHNTRSAGMAARLEQSFAKRFGQGYGIAHANGTATMHTALIAAGVGVGDEIIVPAYTVFSTPAAALYVNAVPIFADVDPNTWTIDPDDVRRKVTARTRAIISVAICGFSPDYDQLLRICRERQLTLIEDNAQCFLGYYKERVVGSFGEFASFSFQGSKHMTCGDGGMLICKDAELATRARKAATLGFSTVSAKPGDTTVPKELRCHPEFQRHTSIGYNFRLPELACAYALGEFERLDALVEARRRAAGLFLSVVKGCDWLVPQATPAYCVHSWWTFAMRLTRDDVDWVEFRRKFVSLGGDGFYVAWLPAHREPVFSSISREVR